MSNPQSQHSALAARVGFDTGILLALVQPPIVGQPVSLANEAAVPGWWYNRARLAAMKPGHLNALERRIRGVLRRLKPGYLRPKLNEELAALPRVFKAPPFDRELVSAIRLIAPHYRHSATERSRSFWEAEQNAACWGEFQVLEPILRAQARPNKILEIGPGMGRSVVFFKRVLGWEDVEFHLYEGDGTTTRYELLGPKDDRAFCGSIPCLRRVLDYNGISNCRILDACELGCDISRLPGPYDVIYSFYAIGYHWALEHFLDEILGVMHDGSLAIFTVPAAFTPFAALEELNYQLLRMQRPDSREEGLLIVKLDRNPAGRGHGGQGRS